MNKKHLILLILLLNQCIIAAQDFAVVDLVNVITGEYCGSNIDLYCGGPKPISLYRYYLGVENCTPEMTLAWHFNLPHVISPNIAEISEKQHLDMEREYLYDENERLLQANVFNPSKTKLFNQLNFQYLQQEENAICEVSSLDGKKVSYAYKNSDISRNGVVPLIEKVVDAEGNETNYTYLKHPQERKMLLEKIENQNGGYVELEYYSGKYNNVGGTLVAIDDPFRDFRIGKIKLKKAPLGPGGSPIITQRFFYENDYTEVIDANNKKTRYYFSKQKKIIKAETYLESDHLYKIERLFWDEDEKFLISRTLEDASGKIYTCKTYSRDTLGHLIEERLYGNLSGSCNAPILLNAKGIPVENGIEFSATAYEYEEGQASGPVKKVEPNGKVTRYVYDEETARTQAMFIGDDENILIRQFFFYDDDGLLIQTITDDGFFEDPNSLHGVTERHIVKITPKTSLPCIGMPQVIEEFYYDLDTQKEVLIKKTLHSYSLEGNLIKKELFDQKENLIFFEENTFDALGRCTYKNSSDGKEIFFEFDAQGNITSHIEKLNGVITKNTRHFYDLGGRKIRSVETDKQGVTTAQTDQFDAVGNKIACCDHKGNKTRYDYDEIGRITQAIYPEMLNSLGEPVHPKNQFSYDVQDHLIESTDARGYRTKTSYNIKGSPTEICYPDGTKESFEYYLDGSLKQKTAKNGTCTIYTRDILSRVVKEESYAPSGKLIYKLSKEYGAFHLLSSVDKNGLLNRYTYDASGKKTALKQITEDGVKEVNYEYDQFGHLYAKKYWYGSLQQFCCVIVTKRNADDDIIEMRIEDEKGHVLVKKLPQDQENVSQNTQTLESREKECKNKTTFDDKGCAITIEYDAYCRVTSITKKDPVGHILKKILKEYDLSGNKVKETHTIVNGSSEEKSYTVAWQYGPCNRLDAVVENEGSHLQKTTSYLYNEYGQLVTIIKPDQVHIHHSYNEIGLPERFFSSDASVDYEYQYDSQGNLISVIDHINNNTTKREYNCSGKLIKEVLGNGLTTAYRYDQLGRKTQTTLPDNSFIDYHFDAANLKKVERTFSDHKQGYSFEYLEHDLNGNVVESDMICDLGKIYYSYDEDGNCISINSDYWSENLILDETKNASSRLCCDLIGSFQTDFVFDSNGNLTQEIGEQNNQYAYDSLGNRKFNQEKEQIIDTSNALTYDGNYSYSYDSNGNMIKKSNQKSCFKYTYDALNRLTSVEIDNTFEINYIYDSLNRRIEKKVLKKSEKGTTIVEKKHFLYSENSEIGEVDQEGNILALRILGQSKGSEIGAAIALEISGKIYAPIHDQQGCVRTIIDTETKKVQECYRYTAFGEETIFNKDKHLLPANKSITPWRYLSKRKDPETALIFFGKRYYQPDIGRWTTLDPLGFEDGINRYLFIHNSPITHIDHYGLFSLSSTWNSVSGFFNDCLDTFMDFASKTLGFIRKETEYLQQVQPDLTSIFEDYFGKGFLVMTGYYNHPLETGVYGQGEVNDKVRISLINGICNVRSYYRESLELLNSTHGGVNIHYIFRPTNGWCGDLLSAIMIKCGYVSPHARALADTWKEMIEEMGGVDGGGVIIHYCHSLGGADTAVAAGLLTPEERAMIHVISFGSATLIPNNLGFADVVNFVSRRDSVSMISDPIHYLQGIFCKDSNVVFIGSLIGKPLVDHNLAMETYTEIITNLGHIFLQMYAYSGNLTP